MIEVDLVVIGNLLLDDLPHGVNIAGGAALFTALAARCHGLRVAVHSVVGTDYPVHLLEEAGVVLSLERLDGPGGRTVIRYPPGGRTLQHVGPCHRELSPRKPHPFKTSLVHIAPMPTSIQAFHLAHCPPRGALLDPYPFLDSATWSTFAPLHDRLAALLLNEEELFLDIADLEDGLWTVLKQAARGGTTLRPSLHWAAVPTTVVDLTGAGDAFAGGLASGLILGQDRQWALNTAAISAGWALEAVGARALFERAAGVRISRETGD